MKNVQSRVRLRREERRTFGVKYGYGEEKNVLSEVWLRRGEKRFERSMATEK